MKLTPEENKLINRIAQEEKLKVSIVYARYWRGERDEKILRRQPHQRQVLFCGRTNKEWYEWMASHGKGVPYQTFMGMKYRNRKIGLDNAESLIQILLNVGLLRTFLIEKGKEDVLDVFS